MNDWTPFGSPQSGFRPMPHEIINSSEKTETWQQATSVNTSEQTAMWQRANYLHDSGYNSGETTPAPSTSGQVEWNQTPTFPQIPPTHFDTTTQNQNQDQLDLTNKQIPVLIDLLNDPDRTLVSSAVTMTSNLAKTDTGARAISNSPQIINTLVKTISNNDDDPTTAQAAATLHHLSYHDHGLRAIFDSGATFALVSLLSSPVQTALNYALVALHNLLQRQDGSKMAIQLAGGVQKMVALLDRNDEKFLAIVTDCLKILAYGSQENKLIILACRGPAELVRIMRTYKYDKLLGTTSGALRVLSVCPSNKLAIVEAGGMQLLTMQLTHRSQRLVQNCLLTLRNLSDVGRTVEPIDALLQHCVRFLGSPDVTVVCCAAGILRNLTCNNQQNKASVCRMDGINILVQTIVSLKDFAEVIEPAMGTLAHLITKHPLADRAGSDASLNHVIPTSVALLNSPMSRWGIVKVVVDLIRNLAVFPVSCAFLRDQGAITRLAQLLVAAYGEIDKGCLWVDGVRMEDVVLGITTALQSFASEPHGRTIIKNLNIVAVLEQMGRGGNESIRRAANEFWCEMMADDVAVFLTESLPATGAPPVFFRTLDNGPQESTQEVDVEWPRSELTDLFDTILRGLE